MRKQRKITPANVYIHMTTGVCFNGMRGKCVSEAGGREFAMQWQRSYIQQSNRLCAGPDVLCHPKSHQLTHQRIDNEMEKWIGINDWD